MPVARRLLLAATIAALIIPHSIAASAPRFRIAFANADETPGVRLDGLGFTGYDVRRGFELAARTLPVEMIYLDNAGDADRAIANAREAVRQKADLLIEFNSETRVNPEIARILANAGTPVIAIGYPVGDAPVYAATTRKREPWPARRSVILRSGRGPIRP